MELDLLKLFRGNSIPIDEYITVLHPTLDIICNYGENKYFSLIHHLCCVGADLKWQLDAVGIDYTKVEDFELFYSYIVPTLRNHDTSIIFNIDLNDYQLMMSEQLQEPVLYNYATNSMISRFTYQSIIDAVRKLHGLKRNDEMPGNEATRQILILDAKDQYEMNKDKPSRSYLLNDISALINSPNSIETYQTIFDLPIYVFFDSIKRINKIKKSDLLLQSGYSGFGINLKEVNKDDLNWQGDVD